MGQIRQLKKQIEACNRRIIVEKMQLNQAKLEIHQYFNKTSTILGSLLISFTVGFLAGFAKLPSKIPAMIKSLKSTAVFKNLMVASIYLKRNPQLLNYLRPLVGL